MKNTMTHSYYAYIRSCLVSDPYAIILMITLTHVSSLQCKIAFTIKNSIRKNWGLVPGLLYHIHTMATHHGGTGHPLNRGLGILTEDTEHADINSDSTHSSDTTEAVDHPENPAY